MRRAAITMSTALIALPALFAGAAQAQDRYGPQAGASLTPVSYAADRPLLTWPGKQPAPSDETAVPPRPAAPMPAPPPASIYTPPPAPLPAPRPPVARVTPPAPMVAPMAPPVPPQASLRAPLPPTKPPMASASLDMRPLIPAKPPVAAVVHTPQPPSPQLVHAAKPKPKPPAAKPPVAIAAAAPAPTPAPPEPPAPPHRPWSPTGPGVPVHFYSTAREFGQQPDPDPVPLSPQFFADSSGGDLAAPPPPLGPRPVPGSQTVGSTATANTAANRARSIALDTPSPDGSSN